MADTGLPRRQLGRTGLSVTRLGYGAFSLDTERFHGKQAPEQIGALLNGVLDAGINFVDTAPDYGPSEELIGRFIADRRQEYFLASKCGCRVVEGRETGSEAGHVFTKENIVAGVEQSLRRLRTDYLDLVQFHGSPSREVMEREGSVEALLDLKQQGKVRFIGMSGTLPHLPGQIAMGVFDVFQIPYSALQREHEDLISQAARTGAGTVIRGGVVRGAPTAGRDWVPTRRLPEAEFVPDRPRQLWEHARIDELVGADDRLEFLLRFGFSHPDIDTIIVGTSNPAHVNANVEALKKGPLPPELRAEVIRRLDEANLELSAS